MVTDKILYFVNSTEYRIYIQVSAEIHTVMMVLVSGHVLVYNLFSIFLKKPLQPFVG